MGGVTPALKGFTLFSCSSLIFIGLLTVDLNAQTITITNSNRIINNRHHNATLIVNSSINVITDKKNPYRGTSLGLYFTNINKLDIQKGASIDSWVDTQSTTINQVDINSGNVAGFHLKGGTKIRTIDLKQGGRMRSVLMRGNASIETLNIEGTLVGWSAYGGINFRDPNGKINTITVKQGGKIEQGVRNNNGTIQTLTINSGTINGGITNSKTIQTLTINSGTINGNIVNSGANASTGSINITGTSNVSGNIVNQNGANFNNQITLEQNSKLGGISNNANSTMGGTLDLKGEVGTISNAGTFNSTLTLSNKVGTISNSGTFNSTLTLSNKVGTIENKQGGTISNDITIQAGGSVEAINNSGTMQNITNNNGTLSHITNSGTMKVITNNGTVTLTLTNSGGTIDKVTNATGATATIHNQGTITKGIINDGGTLTVLNDFRRTEGTKDFQTIGEIGKTAN
ncbi:hypothetical protein NYG92_08725, partial [Campylobacter felis]|uniref:hypothetical protein n=1 Tax=Campylobacter felis TaxID=2974565 RepID=UPI00256DF1E0